MQKHVNLVDLVTSFPTHIFLQNLASIQKRTSPRKFDHLAEKSDKGSTSNLSTKVGGRRAAWPRAGADLRVRAGAPRREARAAGNRDAYRCVGARGGSVRGGEPRLPAPAGLPKFFG